MAEGSSLVGQGQIALARQRHQQNGQPSGQAGTIALDAEQMACGCQFGIALPIGRTISRYACRRGKEMSAKETQASKGVVLAGLLVSSDRYRFVRRSSCANAEL
eukprot:s1948_g11.t1